MTCLYYVAKLVSRTKVLTSRSQSVFRQFGMGTRYHGVTSSRFERRCGDGEAKKKEK